MCHRRVATPGRFSTLGGVGFLLAHSTLVNSPSRSGPVAVEPGPRSAAGTWSKRAERVFPAGSNGEFDFPPGEARVLSRGAGCRVTDAAGRSYIDLSMGWGSVLPGHAHPAIIDAVTRQAALGTNFACVTEPALELAEAVSGLAPAAERVRFCASGTEATTHCLRLARAFTGKDRIVKFEGAYHGSNDEGITSLFPIGPARFPEPELTSAGVAHSVRRGLLVSPFNDADAIEALLETQAGQVAAVIVEPFHRCLAPLPGFLERLRASCTRHGVLLVFDEVVTGFRLALGGAQARYGVTPDLVAYGKALGGGLPIGAYAGRREIMDQLEERRAGVPGYVWSASTLGGNPVSCAAALAAIDLYRQPGVYPRLETLGRRLRDGLRRCLGCAGVAGRVIGDGPLGQIVFTDRPVTDYRSTKAGDSAMARRFMLAMLRRGVWLNPMGTKLYLSLAHDEGSIDAALDVAATALVDAAAHA